MISGKKGFTLIELLAVMVVLAVVLVIAVPTVLNVISNSKKGAFESDANLVLESLEIKKAANPEFDVKSVTHTNIHTSLGLSNANYSSLGIDLVGSKAYITIIGQGKWANYKACGTKNNMKVVPVTDTVNCTGAPPEEYNAPVLATGMTPVIWDSVNEEWDETTESDPEWYSYTTTDKQWANAQTDDGSLWVWIPRYAYQIANCYHMGDAQCTTAASKTSGTINIRFLVDDTNVAFDGETAISETPTYSSHNQTNFIIHPAFTFGSGTNLTGIWVSKFHASTPITHACYTTENATNCNVSTITPNFVPNVKSWRYAQISNIFTATRNMETNNRYGWGTTGSGIDTHLMKNIEWGATLYLAQSAYGKNAAIWNNPSSTYVAGCAGGTISTSAIEGCPYQFYTSNGQQASTTGNIYGIYDMLSNDGEFVAGCINNTYADDYGASLYNADNKYKDLYTPGLNSDETYINIESKKGDAVYETGNGSYYGEIWYGGDSSFLPDDAFPWFLRGHNNNTPFIFSGISGEVEAYRSFHTVLLVGTGL